MKSILLSAAAAALMLVAAQAEAQSSGELTLYGRGQYSGPRLILDGPARAMTLPFTVKSVQVPEGSGWELCSGNTFTGCRRFSTSVPGMAMTVRSARPVGQAVAVKGGTITAQGKFEPAPPAPSLRGMASEFFVAPQKSGRRIEVKPGTRDEALREAGEYCRSIGWGSSAYAGLQSSAGSAFLVDVLCVR
jgi:hypothetical protein